MPANKRETVKEPEYKGPKWQSIESRHLNLKKLPERDDVTFDVVESPKCLDAR